MPTNEDDLARRLKNVQDREEAEALGVPLEMLDWARPLVSFRDHAPLFVAIAIDELFQDLSVLRRADGRPRSALFALCEIVEAVARFLVLASAADLVQRNGGKAPAWLAVLVREQLVRPQFGNWVGSLKVIAEAGPVPALPRLPEAAVLISSLAPRHTSGSNAEDTSLLAVRNALAHGAGGSHVRIRALLDTWGKRVSSALSALAWINKIEVWARDPSGTRRLNGASGVGELARPAASVDRILAAHGVVLDVSGQHISLSPFGRWTAASTASSMVAQLYARRGEVGLLYTLFGADDALQVESRGPELSALDALVGVDDLRAAAMDSRFQERGYDREFQRDAEQLVGRENALGQIWSVIIGATHGVFSVFGQAGIGKSALVARALVDLQAEVKERQTRGHSNELVLAYRFIDGDRGCAPLPFLRWLIERLESALDNRMRFNPQQSVSDLLHRLGTLLSQDRLDRVVVVLDGLDELARREREFAHRLIQTLAYTHNDDQTASKVRNRTVTLIASRPESGLRELVHACQGFDLFPDDLEGMTTPEVRAMLDALLPRFAREFVRQDLGDDAVANAFLSAVVERSKGLPVYIRLLVEDCQKKRYKVGDAWSGASLPPSVEDYFVEIARNGKLSDRTRLGPLIACILAIAREPLSKEELTALTDRAFSADVRNLMRERTGQRALDSTSAVVAGALADLGCLLKRAERQSSSGESVPVYRLYHDELGTFLREKSTDIRQTMSEAIALMAASSRSPGDDAASAYLYRNGVVHICDLPGGVQQAASLLADFDYQLARLSATTVNGGDGGMREDWALLTSRKANLEPDLRDWRLFWSTDGTLFEAGAGRDSAREFIERCLEYAPDATMGKAVDLYLKNGE